MTYRTPEEAFAATAERIGGVFVTSWTYPNGAITARFALKDGEKTFRPYRSNGDGLEDGDPPGLWPLYRKGDLEKFPDEPVFLVEGEAKADVLAGVGLVGVTSAHGSNGAAKTDWTPLAGRELIILPDNDPAGRKYAETVAAIVTALEPPANVRIVTLPGLKVKEDVVDWVAADGPMGDKGTGDIKGALLALAAKAPLWTAADVSVEDTPTTDLGNAHRFTRLATGKAHYIGQWRKWIIPKGGRWKVDDSLDILTLAKKTALRIYDEAKAATDLDRQRALGKWALRTQSRERLLAMVDLARPDLAVGVEELDADPFVLNMLNGVLDLHTGQVRPHRPDDLMTRRANVRFDPAATCPLWDAFLDRIMAGNAALIGYLQRLFGMCLTADIGEQILVIFHGIGANGKNTILDTMTGLMGDYAGEAPPDLLLMRRNPEHPTEIADLCGRRLVVAGEADEGRRLRVQLVKRLTGNARLKARYMRGDFFEFPRSHKLIMHTNSRPVIKETTHAIWRRLQLVPFSVVIPQADWDLHLTGKLAKERSGILNWALAGCLAWQKPEGLNPPPEVLAATAAYQSEQDPLTEFLDAYCTFGPEVSATRTDLYTHYLTWAERSKDRYPLDRTNFYERIRQRSGIEDSQKRLDGRMTRLFKGIGLLEMERIDYET